MVPARDALLHDMQASLNEQQKAAVEFDRSSALQVIAGPGTGKTKVLTSRVAYLLLKEKINPQDIIVTTFTNKAAKEMIDRLVELLLATNIRVSDILIGTFHSICLKILSRFGHKIGLRKDWRIIDESEVNKIMDEMIEKMPDQIRDYAHAISRKVNFCTLKQGSDQWVVNPRLVKREISRLKTFAIIPEEYTKDSDHDPALAYFYERYQGELNKVNALDFDDLLMYTFRLLTRERCLPYIKHVFVDEFQDTNGIQMDLMFLFARGNHHTSRGITVVGDPDQSIYAFRHALANNFEAMVNKCPLPTSRVVLIENYRSSQKILNTSEMLIRQQVKGRPDRLPLKAQFDSDFPPVYTVFPESFLEAPSLIRELLYLKSLPGLFSFNDFAILVRQRRQMKAMENALIEHQVPYKIIRGHVFWELKEAVAMINLLKCLNSNNEINAIIAALQYPPRGLGQTSAERIKSELEKKSADAFDTLKEIANKKIKVTMPEKARAVIKEFIAMIDTCGTLCEGPLTTALDDIFEKLYAMSGMKYEYLYVDGKKKSEVGKNPEPDFSNTRHKNIMILKNYFLGSNLTAGETSKDANKTDTHSKRANANMIKVHIRNFFLSLAMYTSSAMTPDGDQKSDSQKENGFVTMSTIHGAKGLEWPVVFIPGCEEGVIPSIFGEEKDEESNDSSDDEFIRGIHENKINENDSRDISGKDNISNKKSITESPKKKSWMPSIGDTLNEERRMFFVAQTRAKHLLYLSAVDSTRGRGSSPSRFLTSEILHTMVDEQRLFDNIDNIKRLYSMLGKKIPKSTSTFSIEQVIRDYSQFVEKRRERLIWNGSFVNNMYQFDINQNINIPCTNEFSTAAIQLQKENNRKSPERKCIRPGNISSPSRRTGMLDKDRSTSSFINGLPIKTATFAPDYKPGRKTLSTPLNLKKSFAPKIGDPQKLEASNGIMRDLNSSEIQINGSQKTDSSTQCKDVTYGNVQPCPGQVIKREDGQVAAKCFSNVRRPHGSNRKVIAARIDIAPPNDGLNVKAEDISPNTSENTANDHMGTTAGEILHDPDEIIIDDRPIISNAKTLADAAKRTKRKSKPSLFSSQAPPKILQTLDDNGIKSESTLNNLDIFSRLSRARKKSKLNDSEIIIID